MISATTWTKAQIEALIASGGRGYALREVLDAAEAEAYLEDRAAYVLACQASSWKRRRSELAAHGKRRTPETRSLRRAVEVSEEMLDEEVTKFDAARALRFEIGTVLAKKMYHLGAHRWLGRC